MSQKAIEMTWSTETGIRAIEGLDLEYHAGILDNIGQLRKYFEKLLRDLYREEIIRLLKAAGKNEKLDNLSRDEKQYYAKDKKKFGLKIWLDIYNECLKQPNLQKKPEFEDKIERINKFHQKVSDAYSALDQFANFSAQAIASRDENNIHQRHRFSRQPALWKNSSRVRAAKVINDDNATSSKTVINNLFKGLKKELPSAMVLRQFVPLSVSDRQTYTNIRLTINGIKQSVEESRKDLKRQLLFNTKNDALTTLSDELNTFKADTNLAIFDIPNRRERFRQWLGENWVGQGLAKIGISTHSQVILDGIQKVPTFSNNFNLATEIDEIQEELDKLKELHGNFETLPETEQEQEQGNSNGASSRLEKSIDALRAHKKAEKLNKRLNQLVKKLQYAPTNNISEEDKEALVKQITLAIETLKLYLDPYYKYGKWSGIAKLRFVIKMFCWSGAAICGIGALSCAIAALIFPPAILGTLGFIFGVVGLIGVVPLLDTFATSIFNYLYYGRAPITPQATEMKCGGTFFPLMMLTGLTTHFAGPAIGAISAPHTFAHSFGNGVNTFNSFYSHYVINSIGGFLNTVGASVFGYTVGPKAFKAETRQQAHEHSHIKVENAITLMLRDGKDHDSKNPQQRSAINQNRAKWFNIYPETYFYRTVKANIDFGDLNEIYTQHKDITSNEWIKSKPSHASDIANWQGVSFWRRRGLSSKHKQAITDLKKRLKNEIYNPDSKKQRDNDNPLQESSSENQTNNNKSLGLRSDTDISKRLAYYQDMKAEANMLQKKIASPNSGGKVPGELQKLCNWLNDEVRVLEKIQHEIEKLEDNNGTEKSEMGASNDSSPSRLNFVLTAQ